MDELEQACEQVAGESISTIMQREQWRLLERLAEAARPSDQPDPITAKLESLVQSAQAYLSIKRPAHGPVDASEALPLARDLLSLRWELEDEQVTAGLEQAGAAIQVQVEQLTQKHGPIIERAMAHQQVVELLQREDESLHQVLITLYQRLREWVPFDDHDSSERDGVLAHHTEAERMLAAALCEVTDALADDGIHRSAQQLAEQVQAEMAKQTKAHKSQALIRLIRLCSCIGAWLDDSTHDDLPDVMTELLRLCDHLGIRSKQTAGGDV